MLGLRYSSPTSKCVYTYVGDGRANSDHHSGLFFAEVVVVGYGA